MQGNDQERYAGNDDKLPKNEQIAQLNDRLRCRNRGGRVMITRGIQALGMPEIAALRALIAGFDAFTEDNGPYGEREFGSLDFQGEKVFWKIDYYDIDLQGLSPDPASPEVTTRVMTIMLTEE